MTPPLTSALSPGFWFFSVIQVGIGLCMVSVMVAANSIVQISIPQQVRGRVMALWGVCTLGLTPAVSPALGWIGDQFGARATVWTGTIALAVTFLVVIWYLFGKQQIRLYRTDRFHFGVEYPGDSAGPGGGRQGGDGCDPGGSPGDDPGTEDPHGPSDPPGPGDPHGPVDRPSDRH